VQIRTIGIGIAGTTWKGKVLAIKCANASGSPVINAVASGLMYAADNGARTINLSLSTPSNSITLRNAIDYAYNKGCVITASSGNDGVNKVPYPAAYPNVIAVGASPNGTDRASWSNYGPELDVLAISKFYTVQHTSYMGMEGTSFSAPQVAGLSALLLSIDSTLNPDQVKQYIIDGAAGDGSWVNNEVGYGFINFQKSIELLLADMEETNEIEEIVNNKYEVEIVNGVSYITDIKEETTRETIEQNLNLPVKYIIEIKNTNGNILTDTQYVGTGSTITIKNQSNEILKSYTVIVKGDVTGDGVINFIDIVRLTQYVYEPEENFEWKEEIRRAGRVVESIGNPGFADIMLIIRYVYEGVMW